MIVTNRFAFFHLQKSGGTFVNEFILRHFPDAQILGYHLPRALLPREFAALPGFGLVRNPWDYYVSWYSFQAARKRQNPVFLATSENGTLGFNETVTNLVNLSHDRERLARIAAALPDEFTNRGINLTRRCLASLVGSQAGFYTWMFERMYGPGSAVRIGQMETLRTDLEEFLVSSGVNLDERMREFLHGHVRVNTSEHAAASDLFDRRLARLVGERDAPLIERFGYAFPA